LVENEDGKLTVPASGEICEYVTEDNYVFKVDATIKSKIIEWA